MCIYCESFIQGVYLLLFSKNFCVICKLHNKVVHSCEIFLSWKYKRNQNKFFFVYISTFCINCSTLQCNSNALILFIFLETGLNQNYVETLVRAALTNVFVFGMAQQTVYFNISLQLCLVKHTV